MNKVRETLERHHMLRPGDRVIAGVSGGADSVAMLDILCTCLPELGLEVFVCHVNYQLRGNESDQDEAFVRALCKGYHVKLFCFTENAAAWAAKTGQSVELAAREIRYGHFEQLADELEGKIATAHTLSDSMETMLYHFARGTGLRGLAGIPPVRGRIIRPLIDLTRAEVEDYLKRKGLCYRTDSSNLTDAYTRNRIRHRLIPEFYHLNPHAHMAAAHLQTLLRETEDYLQMQVQTALEQSREKEGFRLCELKALPAVLRRAALVSLLREWEIVPDFSCVQRMLSGMEAGSCQIELRQGLFFVCKGGLLYIKAPAETLDTSAMEEISFPIGRRNGNVIQIRNKTLRFLYEEYEHFKIIENIEKSLLKNLVDCDKIGDNAVVRTRRAGDRFTHPVRHWSKSLKKLFNETHIPTEERDSVLVCADSEGVFWVEGFGADARVSPSRDTRRVMEIKITEESQTCAKTS